MPKFGGQLNLQHSHQTGGWYRQQVGDAALGCGAPGEATPVQRSRKEGLLPSIPIAIWI